MKCVLLFASLVACALAGLALAISASPTSAEQRTAPSGATPTPTPCSTSYSCAVTPGATIVPGTTDTGNHCDDCVTNVTLPFSFSLYGASYTSVNVSSNGDAQFVSTNIEFSNICLPVAAIGPAIFAYWEDLVTDNSTNLCTGGCGIYTSVSGSAPNRIFNIEWRTFYFSEPNNAYFEIRLYENTSSFEVILGQVNTDATATIGVQDGAGRFTQCLCNTAPTPNSRIVFSPGACGTPVATNTPSNTPIATSTTISTNTSIATSTVASTGTPTNTPFGSPIPSGTLPPTFTPISNATPTSTPLCAFGFSDVQPSDYFYEAVRYMYCNGIISGYSDGTFRPYNNTTRGQLAKIVVLSVGLAIDCPQTGHFTDVPPDNGFFCYIETAYEHGIISGYSDGSFRPGNNVTRGQLSKIIVQAMGWTDDCPTPGHFTDVPPDSTFFCFVETAYAHGIITGYADGTFRPGNSATRGQICKIVYLAITSP